MISLENIALSERSQHKARTWYDAITVYEMSRIGTSTRQEALVVPTGGGGEGTWGRMLTGTAVLL